MNELTWSATFSKLLDKFPVEKLYEDLFQPGIKKAGEALETVIDLSNTILLPIKLGNAKSRLYFKSNIDRYEEKLQARNEPIIQVPEFVGIPIIERLTYVNQQEISEAYINLLTKASYGDTVGLVHPSFLATIDSLSTDEAKLLSTFKEPHNIPFLEIYARLRTGKESLRKPLFDKLTALEKINNLEFPQNINLYLDNLERLGIVEIHRNDANPGNRNKYLDLEQVHYKELIEQQVQIFDTQTYLKFDSSELRVVRGYLKITHYGMSFIKACVCDISD
jgi:hypothetical protein